MTEQASPDHWEQLVSTFGVSPPPEESHPAKPPEPASPTEEPPHQKEQENRQADASPETPRADSPSRRKPASRSAHASVRRTPQDWGRLAEQLGVAVPPEAEPVLAEQPSREEETAEEGESPFPTLETPAELMSEIAEERTGGFEAGGSRTEEKRGRHRKRRRRGGRPGESASRETAGRPPRRESEIGPSAEEPVEATPKVSGSRR